MDCLSTEIFDAVLEHISSLDDLHALWLTSHRAAWSCANMLPQTLWQITYRTLCRNCIFREENRLCGADEYSLERGCDVALSSLQEPGSVPFKVRAWLYRRASLRSFGISEEVLSGCVVLRADDLENPYEIIYGSGKLSTGRRKDDDNDDTKAREWAAIWCIFKSYLVTQRVQRVNLGDARVRPEWTGGGTSREPAKARLLAE